MWFQERDIECGVYPILGRELELVGDWVDLF